MFGIDILGIATGPSSDLYRVVLAIHILLSIGGFGAVMFNGVYATQSQKRPGPGGRAISEANYAVSNIAEFLIFAVPVAGLVLVWVSDGAISLSDLWIWLSLVLFAIAAVISRVVLMPGHRRINELLAEMDQAGGTDQGVRLAEIEQLGKKSAAAGGGLHLLLVAVIVLMVWQPTG